MVIFNEFKNLNSINYYILGHKLGILLHTFKDLFWNEYNPLEEGFKNSTIVKNFIARLEKNMEDIVDKKHTILTLKDYAEIENYQKNYFNSIIKTKTDKSVNEWINEKNNI